MCLGVLMSAVVMAQSSGLSGRVADPQGAAVVAAVVSVSGAGAGTRTTQTASDGTFSLPDLPAGEYQVQIEAPGFQRWTRSVRAGSGPLDVALQVAGFTEDVVVSVDAPLNLSVPESTASRLNLAPIDTPASVAIVSGDVLRDIGTPTLIVAKALAPGITSSAPMGSGGNVLNARGFTGQNSVKQLFNGMEIYNAGGVVSFPFDPWNVDHIGVLYGPASVLYGSGAIGGAVNVVAKRPNPAAREHEIALSAGSFSTYHAALGATGPVTDRVSYRFDASKYTSDHWVDRGRSNSLAVSGSLRFDATPTLRFTLSNDFGEQNPSTYLGTPVLNNRPVEGLRYKNYNVDDAKLNFMDNWTNVETVWTPSSRVSIHNNTYYMYHDRFYHDVFTFAYVPATAQVRRTQFRDIDDTWETQYGDTGYVKYAGQLFGRPSDVLVGLDYNINYYNRNDNIRGGTSLVDAVTFNPGYYRDFYQGLAIPFYRMDVDQVAGFVENHLKATERLSLVVGARRDHYHVNRYDHQTLATTVSDHNATAWNAGVIYDIFPGLSVYGQAAEASDPVNSFSSIAANQQGFNLSPGRQLEAGVKQVAMNNRLEWTFATYRLVKEDLLTPAVSNPSLTEQVGQQSSRGVEASLALSAGPVRVNVNGTVLNAEFDEFRAVVAGASVSLAGNVPINVPESSANLMVFYDVAPQLQLRAVVRHVGRRFADNTNVAASLIPSFTVADLGARWQATSRLSLDLRVDNAFDEIYADSGSATAWLLGMPRSVTLGTRIGF